MRRRSPDSSGAFTPVAVLFVAGLIGGILANLWLPLPIMPGPGIQVMGIAPLLLGGAIFTWARAAFRRHRTTLMPWTPTSALVTDGPYGYSRNPVYLSFALMYLGLALAFDSAYVLILLVVVVALFDRFQIPREERYLRALFGVAYDSYSARVRRWI